LDDCQDVQDQFMEVDGFKVLLETLARSADLRVQSQVRIHSRNHAGNDGFEPEGVAVYVLISSISAHFCLTCSRGCVHELASKARLLHELPLSSRAVFTTHTQHLTVGTYNVDQIMVDRPI